MFYKRFTQKTFEKFVFIVAISKNDNLTKPVRLCLYVFVRSLLLSSMAMYIWFADLVVVFHLLWIGFLIFGALIGRKVQWVMFLHIASLMFSLILQLFGWICPLTHLEIWLREKAGGGYTSTFIEHYVEQLVYLTVPRWIILFVTLLIVTISLILYCRSYWNDFNHSRPLNKTKLT